MGEMIRNQLIKQWAAKYAVDPALVFGVMMQESGGNANAARFDANYRWLVDPPSMRPSGCSIATERNFQSMSIGLMQVMGAVFRECGFRGWLSELFADESRQIQYGAKHLAKMVRRFGMRGGISAYNAGRPIESNHTYVESVLEFAKGWKA